MTVVKGIIWVCVFIASALVNAKPTKSVPVTLRVFGAAYLSEMKPLLDDFSMRNPNINVQYRWMSSEELDSHIRSGADPQPDITISSVMHLQLRLVNDGYASEPVQFLDQGTSEHSPFPVWSHWRNALFGFSFEPAVVVFNKAFVQDKEVPTNRTELLGFIRQHSEELMGRIGLFDIRKVGIGYLLWSFERQQARNYGQFLELFNYHYARTFDSTRSMLRALSEGQIAMSYQVVGSYANSWQKLHDDIVVVPMEDYTPVILRTAFINRTTQNTEQAKQFISYLLSSPGQWVMAEQTNMPPIRLDVTGEKSAQYMRQEFADQLKPLPLDVRLLVFADKSKKEIVITEWENALKNYD